MPLRTMKIKKESKLHKDLVARLTSLHTLASGGQSIRHDKWRRAEELVLAYVPETEADAVRKRKRDVEGDQRYTTIMLPYTYALLMSAHTYWTSVFFARSPVHQFVGRHGEGEMQVLAVEALISYQVEVGEMLAPYYIWLYDAGKYGHGVLGQYWTVDMIHYGEMISMETFPGSGEFEFYQATHEVEGYRGNRVYNVSPYDFWHDPRVTLTNFQNGEFCISRRRLGWAAIKSRETDGYFVNIDELQGHISKDKGATDGSSKLERPDFSKTSMYDTDDLKQAKNGHPAGMTFLEFYVKLIPKEWGLGPSMYPQQWCITITEDLGLIVGCSPLGYIHGRFPFDILEPEVEAYGIFNRGLPEIMEPIQNTVDWLINTHFYNVRAAVNNQFIIDPSKLVIKDAKKSGPGFVWRLRPEAYGQDIRTFFHQIPVQDYTQQNITDIHQMKQFGEMALGINDQLMGAMSQGGRKTATEVRTSTGFGVNRQKTICEYMSAHGFTSHATKLLQTSQQFYDAETKLRVVGDTAKAAGLDFLDVSPEEIAGFYTVVPADGVLPVDRMAQANLWKEILLGLTRMPPQIGMSYDFAKIFGWMAQLGGLKNIEQMKVRVLPNDQLGQMAQAGNVVPLRAGGPGVGSPDVTTTMGQNAILPPTAQGGYGA